MYIHTTQKTKLLYLPVSHENKLYHCLLINTGLDMHAVPSLPCIQITLYTLKPYKELI